eukprot:CAMPEP_0182447116 /NCGR_PEP_ID=MMETSP1172-20130603/11495_1 /TAXON_ID=708627 /ORGANISM="Timspurckia oligopyrenoides, Strain CCMP3278" /LENGTH=102 /DNA_ID=CAMNT_0024643417 /DNA_START=71 /DNA_END=376 /DNA_ORIENTATION=+
MVNASVPLVRPDSLSQYVGREVVIAGKVVSDGAEMILQCEEGGVPSVRVFRSDSSAVNAAFVQICGRVNQDSSIQQISCYPLGESFDLSTYYQMVSLASTPE